MLKKSLISLVSVCTTALMLSSCTVHYLSPNDDLTGGSNQKSSAKDITSFNIGNIEAVIDGTEITVTMPFGTTDLNLAPTIIITEGAGIAPASGVIQDFTNGSIVYIVVAPDSSIKVYNVTVKIESTYTVTYNGNNNTGGTAPTDSNLYTHGTTVTVADAGTLVRSGSIFTGWNAASNGTGTSMTAGSSFIMGTSNITLYAQWSSSDATLKASSTVKGKLLASLGTPASIVANVSAGSITISPTQAAADNNSWGYTTLFDPNAIESTVKVVKYASGESTSDFETKLAYADQAINTLDLFIIKVTAQDSTTLYYKIIVTVSHVRDAGPAGGLIFYDKGFSSGNPSWRYLEAAPSDQSVGIQWYNGVNTYTGATATVVGTGQANTTRIVTSQESGSYAAKLCEDLVTVSGDGVYDDWFLPSKDELTAMYTELKLQNTGDFTNSWYWSSSEHNYGQSGYALNFLNGDQGSIYSQSKTTELYVRCVRAFNLLPNEQPSSDATLKASSTVKGEFVVKSEVGTSLGTPSSVLNSVVSGAVTIKTEQAANTSNAGNFITLFNPTSSAAHEVKVVKYAAGESTSGFESDPSYTTEAITDQDFFIIKVTAQDATTSLYYKVVVTVSLLREVGPAGGLIFYDKGSSSGSPSWRYLEAATIDQSTGIVWYSVNPTTTNATGTTIGTGQSNTTTAVASLGTGSYAAQLCNDLVLSGYDDWFLPSKDELNAMYTELKLNRVGSFAQNWYWSSSERNYGYSASSQYFANGDQGNNLANYKTSVQPVRCVRAFDLNSDATLKSSSTVKGVTVSSLGTPNSVLGSVVAGSVIITLAQAEDTSNLITLFEPANSGATVDVVQYAEGDPTNNFENDPIYNNEAIIDQDFFIIRVTAENFTTALYYKIVVTVTQHVVVYALGDTGPSGGLIFYINPNYATDGWEYLEAAPSDQSIGIQWSNGSSVTTGATGTAIGTGRSNTASIIAAQGAGSYAASLCSNQTIGGYSDWFLPSKDELNLMRVNLTGNGVGGFAFNLYYWSSSELDILHAWNQLFHFGSQLSTDKNSMSYVRCARAFSTASLSIGDSYGGGIVAYILQPGDHGYVDGQTRGLIAATADQSTGIQWFNGILTSVGTTSTAIGTGYANTNTIISSQGAIATSYAAGLARAYNGGGYYDWYLPSKDELNKLYELKVLGFSAFIDGYYWSSSESGEDSAWGQYFDNGPYAGGKAYSGRVRAVRSFGYTSDATLNPVSTIKGEIIQDLGTPNATIAGAVAGEATITSDQAADISNTGSFVTLFDPASIGSTIKVVKYAYGESTANFETDLIYSDQAISTLDFFIIKVTAQDSTILYYKIVVTVTSSTSYSILSTGPAGGTVFYDKGFYSDGWRYLEMAYYGYSLYRSWYNGSYQITGASGTAVGTGRANTLAIVANQGVGTYAAQYCKDLVVSGYSDWFLPSKDELNTMYVNINGYGNPIQIWSSSESSGTFAWSQSFSAGAQISANKSTSLKVYPIRAF